MDTLRPAVFVLLEHPRDPSRVLGVWHAASARWALPGGKLEDDEDLATGARRELREETGLDGAFALWSLVRARGMPDPDWEGRQPRDLIVFAADLPAEELDRIAGTVGPEGSAVAWVTMRELVSFFGAGFVEELDLARRRRAEA